MTDDKDKIVVLANEERDYKYAFDYLREEVLGVLEGSNTVYGVTIVDENNSPEGGPGSFRSYFTKGNPWDLKIGSKAYQDFIMSTRENNYQLDVGNNVYGLSVVNINDLAQIIKDYPFDKEIDICDDFESFKVESLEQFQSFFISEYAMSLVEKSNGVSVDDISQPPTRRDIIFMRSDVKNLFDKYKGISGDFLLVNDDIDSKTVEISSVIDNELIIPTVNKYPLGNNRMLIDWKKGKGISLLVGSPSVVINYSNDKNSYVNFNDSFHITPQTKIVYVGDEAMKGGTSFNQKNSIISSGNKNIEINNIEGYILNKISSIRHKRVEYKRISNKSLVGRIANHLNL